MKLITLKQYSFCTIIAFQTRNINNTNDPQKKHCLGTVSKILLVEGF